MYMTNRFVAVRMMLLAGSMVILTATPAAWAQDSSAPDLSPQETSYNLPPAPLLDTLRKVERLSGKRILIESPRVSSLRSSVVLGRLTPEEAVAAALAGTRLSVTTRANGDLVVGAIAQDDEIVVIAQRDEAETGFKASRSDTATRSGASLREIPGSVTIITGRVLESQQSLSVSQALSNVSGLTLDPSPQGPAGVNVRGLSATAQTVNGLEDNSATATNILGVERIEVLKGPQAILAGANSFGGGVNIVTKKPQPETYRAALLQYGTYGDFTAALDLTGKLSADGKFSYRLIGSAAAANKSPGKFNGREDFSVLPQLRFRGGGTDLVVGASWSRQFSPLARYTFARRDGLIVDAPTIRLGNADDGFRSEQQRYFYQLEQSISRNVTLISRLQYSDSDLGLRVFSASGLAYNRGAAPDSPNGNVSFFGAVSNFNDRTLAGDHYLRITGQTGPITHSLSVGVNHSRIRSRQETFDGPFITARLYPQAADIVFPSLDLGDVDPFQSFYSRASQVGVYAQDLMSWGPVNLLLNLRRTRYSSSSVSEFNFGGEIETVVTPKESISTTTPGVGVVVRLAPQLSVYASYAEGFSPQFQARCGGGLTLPITSENSEIGAKLDLFGGKLFVTGSAFRLKLSNQLSFNATGNCFDQLDGQTTKGLELDVQGEIVPGWSIIANYTYNTYKDGLNPTRIFAGLPRHKANIWSTYTLRDGPLKGLGGGLGLTANSRFDGNRQIAFPYKVPGQVRVDTSLFYERTPWNFILGVKNLLNERLYGYPSTAVYVPLQDKRTVTLTVKRTF